MECLCIVCHKAITPARQDRSINPKAIFCTMNAGCCRSNWRDQQVKGRPPAFKHVFMKDLAAFRREQDLVLSLLAARFPAYARQLAIESAEQLDGVA